MPSLDLLLAPLQLLLSSAEVLFASLCTFATAVYLVESSLKSALVFLKAFARALGLVFEATTLLLQLFLEINFGSLAGGERRGPQPDSPR